MSENHYQQLAKQFIAMWQQQLATSLMDERFVGQMIDMMHQGVQMPFNNSGSGPFNVPPVNSGSGPFNVPPNGQSYASAAPSHPNSAVSPDTSGNALAELERRLAATEAKLRAVEAELAAIRGGVSPDGGDAPARRRPAGKRRTAGTGTKKR